MTSTLGPLGLTAPAPSPSFSWELACSFGQVERCIPRRLWSLTKQQMPIVIVCFFLIFWITYDQVLVNQDLQSAFLFYLKAVGPITRGIWAMIAVFLCYCLLQAPATILIRPHPSVWRLVHGIAVVYLVFLTFLLFQSRDGARQFMKHLHKDLGVELPERSYGADCRLYTPENSKSRFINLYDTVLDEFVIAHALGWWGKAIMIRNGAVLWILSIGFELEEVTFKHMLPNFNECWWDSIILDVLICNWLGIWAGMKTVQYFDGKTYEWVGLSLQPDIIGKVKRSLGQFTPAYWDKDEWHLWSGPLRFVQVLGLVVIILAVELNAFFLKYCLWVPPTNPLNTGRLVIWWLIANPAIREYNAFLQDRKPIKKVGAFAWLSLAIALVEVLICIKFGQGLYPEPMPKWVFWFWVTFGLAFVSFLLIWWLKLYLDSRSHACGNDVAAQNKKVE